MADIKEYKKPIIIISVIIGVLMIMLTVGFTVGILSEDPDGLERSLIDVNGGGEHGEEWVEGLPSVWDPILGWIENDYVAGLIGVALSVLSIIAIFYLIIAISKKSK